MLNEVPEEWDWRHELVLVRHNLHVSVTRPDFLERRYSNSKKILPLLDCKLSNEGISKYKKLCLQWKKYGINRMKPIWIISVNISEISCNYLNFLHCLDCDPRLYCHIHNISAVVHFGLLPINYMEGTLLCATYINIIKDRVPNFYDGNENFQQYNMSYHSEWKCLQELEYSTVPSSPDLNPSEHLLICFAKPPQYNLQ